MPPGADKAARLPVAYLAEPLGHAAGDDQRLPRAGRQRQEQAEQGAEQQPGANHVLYGVDAGQVPDRDLGDEHPVGDGA